MDESQKSLSAPDLDRYSPTLGDNDTILESYKEKIRILEEQLKEKIKLVSPKAVLDTSPPESKPLVPASPQCLDVRLFLIQSLSNHAFLSLTLYDTQKLQRQTLMIVTSGLCPLSFPFHSGKCCTLTETLSNIGCS
ncbi:hypothetical protein AAHC03_025523 [Spirometra sp. Aus1]